MKIAATALLALLLAPAPLAAQQWPTKQVKIVVPFAPGSTPDMVGRVIADDLQARHPGISVIVENKPGASGNTGTDYVAKSKPCASKRFLKPAEHLRDDVLAAIKECR